MNAVVMRLTVQLRAPQLSPRQHKRQGAEAMNAAVMRRAMQLRAPRVYRHGNADGQAAAR